MNTFIILAFALMAPLAYAETPQAPLAVVDGVVNTPLKGTNVTAGYGTLKNTSKNTITVSVVSAEGFKAVELHETKIVNGTAKMSKVANFRIEPGASVELKPGGNHIMLFDPPKNIVEPKEVPITFAVGKENFTLPFKMKARGADSHDHHSHH